MNARDAALALLAGSLMLTACAGAPARRPEGRTVEAEGWAPQVAGDPAGGRQRALAAAQKRAVEEASGVRVAAATRVDAAVTTRQRIWADTAGRIETWTVLKEWIEDGLHKTRIRAVVRAAEPSAAAAIPPSGVRVRVESAGPAAAALRRTLSAGGFDLVEKDADYAVSAKTSARPQRDARLGEFASSRARVVVSVSDAATGAVVWENAGEAAALGEDALAAAARAGEEAAEAAGRDAAAGLSELAWRR